MENFLSVKYTSIETFDYDIDGHYHIFVPTFYSQSSYSNDRINYIFDTGAYITVINKEIAAIFGFDLLPPIVSNIALKGFAGECTGDMKIIPGLIIGSYMLKNIKVAIPYADIKSNILGLNVLENFNYFLDNTNDFVYFSLNSAPNIPEELQCGSIELIT